MAEDVESIATFLKNILEFGDSKQKRRLAWFLGKTHRHDTDDWRVEQTRMGKNMVRRREVHEALECFQIAANAEYPQAMYALSVIYAIEDVVKNSEMEKRWLQSAKTIMAAYKRQSASFRVENGIVDSVDVAISVLG
jgi:TPR repeat protein